MGLRQDGISIAASKDQVKKPDPDAAVKISLGKIKNKFIVMSGKGGVGKTSTSVNLSIALANKGFKVGLMDVDLHGPDIPRMLGLSSMLDLNKDRKLVPTSYSENLKAVSIESLSINKDDAIIWRGPMKYSAIRQFVSDVAWGELDFLITMEQQPEMAIEVKWSDGTPSRNFSLLKNQLGKVRQLQLVKELDREKTYPNGIEVRNAASWLSTFSALQVISCSKKQEMF